jgi:NADH:quinone reductase (non-electrogenic)
MKKKKHIVIVGGGFGGLNAAIRLSKSNVQVTLIDKRNFHLFQPLLYQVASGALSPADISFPLRAIFKNKKNVNIIQGNVTDIDYAKKNLLLEDKEIKYDFLIIATGTKNHYYGNDTWKPHACGLKTLEDATKIRNKILSAFERAEIETDKDKKDELLTFVIIGGGPSGIEMAGAIGELAKHTLHCDFRNIDPANSKIILIEGGNRILPMYPESLSAKAEKNLKDLGVKILTNNLVNNIGENVIELKTHKGQSSISTKTIIWAAGVKAESLSKSLSKKDKFEIDNSERIIVNQYCSIPNNPSVFVIGDIANFKDDKNSLLPGVAPVAIQQGKYVAKFILNNISGKENRPFKYFDKGTLSVIGRKAAVAFRGNIKLSGLFAWLIWLFVHLLYLVGFENRILVATQWAFNYFTFNRSARLIANSIEE